MLGGRFLPEKTKNNLCTGKKGGEKVSSANYCFIVPSSKVFCNSSNHSFVSQMRPRVRSRLLFGGGQVFALCARVYRLRVPAELHRVCGSA